MGRLLCLALALLVPVSALAAPPPTPPPARPADIPPPPPPPPPAAVDCFPACRTGFFCYQGACRSACNPPCQAGEQCLESGQCVVGSADAPLAAPGETRPSGPVVSEDGEKAPPGYHFEMQRKKGLLIAGPVLFGVGYVFSLLYGVFGYTFAGIGSSSRTSWIYLNRSTYLVYAIPIAGPALSQVLMATSFGYSSTNRNLELLFAGIVTTLQATGLALALLGIKSSQVLVEDRRAGGSMDPPPMRLSIAAYAPGAPFGVSLLLEN